MTLASFALLLASPSLPVLLLQAEEAGRGALRPYLHIFVAYAIAWILILFWVWRISRKLKGVEGPPSGG